MLLKGVTVSESFYPFVENGASASGAGEAELAVRYPARIAVYDDAAAAPRVVVIEPSDIRTYLEEITATVTRLAQEQGGRIPFTVIREVVENLIHAYFIEPTVSILDAGNTIRFSDQGPGITDKRRALEYGTTSATTEMKRYIRGVGSGLPYAQQWLEDKGGSLTVEDNILKGTVVTVTLNQSGPTEPVQEIAAYAPQQQGFYQQGYYQPQQVPQPWQQTPATMPAYGYPQQPIMAPYGQPQMPYQPQPGMPTPYGQPQVQPGYPQQPQPAYQPAQQPWSQAAPTMPTQPQISERGMMVLEYLKTHDSVGPRDLNAIHPLSESTWSRALAQLEEAGLVSKQGGQKRRLTDDGRQMLGLSL